MRILASLGLLLLLLAIAAVAYAYLGFYNVAATDPHFDAVRWSLDTTMERSIERHATREVGEAPPLDDPAKLQTGAHHFVEEGCVTCHGGPGRTPAGFAAYMKPEPPDLSKAAAERSDTELFWVMKHGLKMTAMPAFGPTHDEAELWAMVAFVRRLPEMSAAEFESLTAAPAGADHGGGGEDGAEGSSDGHGRDSAAE